MRPNRAMRVERDEPLQRQDNDRPVEDVEVRAELRNCVDCERYVYCYLTGAWPNSRHLCGRCRRIALGK